MDKRKRGHTQTMESRARIANTMRANSNGNKSQFSKELLGDFGTDPELANWIKEHAKDLDSANPDGSMPLSVDQIEAKDGYPYIEERHAAGRT